jgi:hypothetical protein
MPIIKQYVPSNIFNMDETALFYNVQPKRILTMKGKRCPGGKAYREGDRATVFQHRSQQKSTDFDCWQI